MLVMLVKPLPEFIVIGLGLGKLEYAPHAIMAVVASESNQVS